MNYNYTAGASQLGAYNAGIAKKVDLIDLCIFEALCKFSNSRACKKQEINRQTYFLFSWKIIPVLLPLAGIKSRAGIKRRMKNLCDCDLLEASIDNEKLGQSMYRFGENHDVYWSGSPIEKDIKDPVHEKDTPSTKIDGPVHENRRDPSINMDAYHHINPHINSSERVSPPSNPLLENENKVVEHIKAVGNTEQKIDTAKNGILELLKTEQYAETVERKIRGKNLRLENEVEKWLRYNSETVNFLNESPLKISSSLIPWLIGSRPQKAQTTSTPSNLSDEQLKILENCKGFLSSKAPLVEIDEPYLISKIKKGLTGISLYHLVNQANVQGFKKADWDIKNLLGLFYAQVNPSSVSQKGSKFIKW